MAGGFRAPIPTLGLSASPVVTQGGFRSAIPPVGYGSPPSVVQGGFRSLTAFWMGGATAGKAIEIPSEPQGGPRARGYYDSDIDQALAEDEEILAIVMAFLEIDQ